MEFKIIYLNPGYVIIKLLNLSFNYPFILQHKKKVSVFTTDFIERFQLQHGYLYESGIVSIYINHTSL